MKQQEKEKDHLIQMYDRVKVYLELYEQKVENAICDVPPFVNL